MLTAMKNNIIDNYPFLHKIYHESIISGLLHFLKRIFIFILYKSKAAIQYLSSISRSIGCKDSRFQLVRSYKDKYKGKRCFIACTGPSLTIADLESLEGEYVFGMNSIALIHDLTTWKPDFYSIQDIHVFNKLKNVILTTDNGIVFAPYVYKTQYNTPSTWVYWHMCGAYHIYEMIYPKKYFAKYSDDCYARVYDGYSVTYSILQLATYMGFEEIYLIGADCSYLGKQHHFIESGHFDPGYMDVGDRLIASYSAAKEYAANNNIKIYNATRGGCLELFPRVKLEDVLATSEKNKLRL